MVRVFGMVVRCDSNTGLETMISIDYSTISDQNGCHFFSYLVELSRDQFSKWLKNQFDGILHQALPWRYTVARLSLLMVKRT